MAKVKDNNLYTIIEEKNGAEFSVSQSQIEKNNKNRQNYEQCKENSIRNSHVFSRKFCDSKKPLMTSTIFL